MSKKIIYSIWSDLTVAHTSVNDYKKESFNKYKDTLIKIQKDYAFKHGADYELFTPVSTDYTNVQFDKILKFEDLTNFYDQVVYFDLDIIPITKKNIFEEFSFDNICIYDYLIDINNARTRNQIKYFFKEKKIMNHMNRHSKVCAKNAMLLLHDIVGNQKICNTGVIAGNKKAAEALSYSKNIKLMNKTLKEAKKDSLYPEEYSKGWIKNNEIYFSFLLEKYNIKYNNIGIQWNYILDDLVQSFTPAAHLIHQVNKDFHETIPGLKQI